MTYIRPNGIQHKESRDSDRHYFVNRSRSTVTNIYAPYEDSAKFIKLLLTNLNTLMQTVVVGNSNTTILLLDRSFTGISVTKTRALNENLEKLGLLDIFRAFHLPKVEYSFFVPAHRTLSKIDNILRHN